MSNHSDIDSAASVIDDVDNALREGQLLVLELIAAGDTREGVLATLCTLVQRFAPQGRALILVAREDAAGVEVGAAPSFEARTLEGSMLLARIAQQVFDNPTTITQMDVPSWLAGDACAAEAADLGITSLLAVPVRGPESKPLGLFVLTSSEGGPLPAVASELVHEYCALASVTIRNDQRERSLLRSQEAIREAQRIGRFGDLTLTVGSGHMTWSEQTYQLYGLPTSGPVPSVPAFVALHLPPGQEVLARALRGDGPANVDVEVEVDLPNGQRAHHSFLLSRIRTAGAQLRLTGTVQDITERKRTENALQQAQRLESLGLLAGGIAHDFNNLLAALLAHVNLMQRRLPSDSPAASSLTAIDGIVQRATDLTRQMLTYAGRSKVRQELVDIDALVSDMTGLLAAAMPGAVEVVLELHAANLAIQGDPAQLQQVVMNLVTNAVDAIGEERGRVTVRTYTTLYESAAIHARFPEQDVSEGEFIVLEVEDTGVGMSPATLAKMFDPFFTTKRSGRGLGMSAVRGILSNHGAGVQIESALGEGTLMRVAFPIEGVDKPARMERYSTAPPQAAGCLLFAEDEAAVRDACAAALVESGYQVVVAADGAEALRLFEQAPGRFRAVLSDLRMPRLNGCELFERVRRLRPDVPFILCTGYGDSAELDGVNDARRTVVLEKPLRIEDLVVTIERLSPSTE
ncbi:MAG: response regulator [Sandaracinaceae bacterium]|nr:response regulator [Sandaracinaceae bacterium]